MLMVQSKYFLNRSTVLDALSCILLSIKNNKPLSLIRLGDGEGRFLGYPEFVSKTDGGNASASLNNTLNTLFGSTDFTETSLKKLSLELREAVKNADIIGLPRKEQCESNIAYQYVLRAMECFKLGFPRQMYVDAAIHRYLQFGLFYKEILSGIDFLGLITGRDVAPLLKKTFQVGFIDQYLIPAEAIHPGKVTGNHYPDYYYSLRDNLVIPYEGAVFLVGAGCLGKIYCNWIKQAGGIAIDIGSIFDSWASEGRLQHDLHKIAHYKDIPDNQTLGERVARCNYACKYFAIKTNRLTSNNIEEFMQKKNNNKLFSN
jgi:hypothetical protein